MLLREALPGGEVPGSEITDPARARAGRRALLRGAAAGAITLATGLLADRLIRPGPAARRGEPLRHLRRGRSPLSVPQEERPTPYDQVTGYNNFYEFGTDKYEPARRAGALRVRPWTVLVEGLVERPRTFAIEELLRPEHLEERVYRMRCVEAWSMVIPWIGLELAHVLKQVGPLSAARFVELHSLHDPKQMPGQRSDVLEWPYIEGLRMDEALHPLTLLAVGLYGEVLPGQNGAPVRLVVPWKYGFKSAKSIVRIRLVAEMPRTTWAAAAPGEYGFYANVNPEVSHPRWSQARERRLGEMGMRPTQPFNGYGEQVAHLYAGMDLRRSF